MKYFQSKTHRHPQLVTMPVCKAEAHRALELLEDYYTRLDAETDERQLRAAIERVIRIFKSRLFQALLDIQEFYELTLMDETKSTNVKTAEALHMASRWEIAGPPGGVRGLGDSGNIELGEKQKEELLRNLSSIANDTHALNLGGGETNGGRPAPAPAPSRLPPEPAPSPAAVPPPDPAPAPAVAARPSAMARSVSAAANDQVIVWFSSFHKLSFVALFLFSLTSIQLRNNFSGIMRRLTWSGAARGSASPSRAARTTRTSATTPASSSPRSLTAAPRRTTADSRSTTSSPTSTTSASSTSSTASPWTRCGPRATACTSPSRGRGKPTAAAAS